MTRTAKAQHEEKIWVAVLYLFSNIECEEQE